MSIGSFDWLRPFAFPRVALLAGSGGDRRPLKHIHFRDRGAILHRLDHMMFPIPRLLGGSGQRGGAVKWPALPFVAELERDAARGIGNEVTDSRGNGNAFGANPRGIGDVFALP